MAVFPIHPVIWSSLLVLWFLQSAEIEGHSLDFCQSIDLEYQLSWVHIQNSAGLESDEDLTDIKEDFVCVLYPTNELNCSWSFNTLEKDTQLSVCISVCNETTEIASSNCIAVEKVGCMPLTLSEKITEVSEVILHLNMSEHNNWTSYTYVYDMDTLELLSPPPNISASFSDGVLNVTWHLPHTRNHKNTYCFEYELDIGDQEGPKHLKSQLNYTKLNADSARAYKVRMRTRIHAYCSGSLQWSEWSPTITVGVETSEAPFFTLKPLVIIFICLGIPMILLAVLLFVRYQRVIKILFPPIPRPPPKYKHFLEKSDTFNFFYSVTSAKPEEEITEVEDPEKISGKTE